MDNIDYSKITDNHTVVELLKIRNKIEKKITELDKMALVNYEIKYLSLDNEPYAESDIDKAYDKGVEDAKSSVIQCLQQVNDTLERHGKVEVNTDLHNKIRNTI